ncbi:TPA: hypothetical protein ACH3X3_000434 [Trebouxia sp. C0006]
MKEALLPSSTSAGSGLEDGTSCSSDSETSYDKAEVQHAERSPWVVTGEYALAALLAITFMYTLAFSHTSHTQFSAGTQHTKHWWKARHDVPGWAEQHQQYVEEAIAASQSSALQLDFYGDAVVEAWRGTQHGEPHARCLDAPDIFNAHFGKEFESHAWGVAGDAAQHLMWRLRNGEALASEGPQLAVLMVGSTDLTYASFKVSVFPPGRRAHTQCGQHYSQQNTCCGRVPVRSEAPVTSLACGLAASRGPHSVFRPTSGAAQQVHTSHCKHQL